MSSIVPPPINLNPRQVDQLKGVIRIDKEEGSLIVMLLSTMQFFLLSLEPDLVLLGQPGERSRQDQRPRQHQC